MFRVLVWFLLELLKVALLDYLPRPAYLVTQRSVRPILDSMTLCSVALKWFESLAGMCLTNIARWQSIKGGGQGSEDQRSR